VLAAIKAGMLPAIWSRDGEISNLDAETVSVVRSLSTSFGTCSTDEPVHDLVILGLAGKD
jgi:hypothetical protein